MLNSVLNGRHLDSSESQNNSGNDFSQKWRQVRACARCHRLKMKCSYEDPSYLACKRCFAIGVECSPDEDPTAKFARRKKRKTKELDVEEVDISKESSKVAKLLEEAMISLNKLEEQTIDPKSPRVVKIRKQYESISKKFKTINGPTEPKADNLEQLPESKYPDIPLKSNLIKELVFNYKLITLEESQARFDYFLNSMLPYYPVISFSSKLKDFYFLAENSPLLLTAIICVTAINDNLIPDLDSKKTLNNVSLFNLLSYYLENLICHQLYRKSEDFTYHLVYTCLILSLWCPPPRRLGNFKNQLNLLMAFNVSLCIDLSESVKYGTRSLEYLQETMDNRNEIRAFLSVYCCCGSLGLSLPKFKLVSWSKSHEEAVKLLLQKGKNLPTENDRFLCCFAQVIYLGQEIFEFLSSSGSGNTVSEINSSTKRGSDSHSPIQLSNIDSLPLNNVKWVINGYEQLLYLTLVESGFMQPSSDKYLGPSDDAPKEKYLLAIIYYQMLMLIYDNLVSDIFYHQHDFSGKKSSTTGFEMIDKLAYLQHISKLIKICENLLNSFIILNMEETINYPSFFYYRPLHALILLIRLRLLLKSQIFKKGFPSNNPEDLKISVEQYFHEISKIFEKNEFEFKLLACSQMSSILSKIYKWMIFSESYNAPLNAYKDNLNLVNLMNMSKDQEIENLEVPKELNDTNKEENITDLKDHVDPPKGSSEILSSHVLPEDVGSYANMNVSSDPTEIPSHYSLEDIFKEIDQDILNYLNPLESNFAFNNNDNVAATPQNTHNLDEINLFPSHTIDGATNESNESNARAKHYWGT
ncbi:uncharacterized protein PRCAT00001078001 [Priceomyces carsonii]|uniref:uncharacterized protein n=1 Tax=Priceomyces carsonii TaxID=28549 RepID=UPI002ED926A1|nr:unnamed protein product [Priceomyces carsonii]